MFNLLNSKIMTKKLTFLVIGLLVSLITTQAQVWTQIGADIDGEAAGDWSGYSVSLSSDGLVIAIGAYENDGNGSSAGHVRIYQNLSGTWAQIGQDIDGEAADDSSGYSVSLSADGSVVAIGAYFNDGNGEYAGHVRIYQNQIGTWTQIGQDIDGEAANDRSGLSVSLSSDGVKVAIGAFGNDGNGSNAGHVRIYQIQSGTWTQIGQDIDGYYGGDHFGYRVSLSSDGSTVAIKGSLSFAGYVRIYQNQSGTWEQIGQYIEGEAVGDGFGVSISLSADGSVVAIGAMGNDGNGSYAGHVRIFKNQSGAWTQIGQDIDGEAAGDEFGVSVSLSTDGLIVAIGATDNDGNGSDAGHVRIYQNLSGIWTQIGQDIDGEAAHDYSGYSVSLSADGSVVAIGTPHSDAGHVRVYELLQPPSITNQPANQTNICPESNTSFSVTATDADTYQWQVNQSSGFANISNGGVYSNATTNTLNITGVTFAMNNYEYRCILTNTDGNTTSNTAVLSTDNQNPVTPTLVTLTSECSVIATAPTTTDNCAGTVTGTTSDQTEYTEQGTYSINWTFADGNGNSTTAQQTVIVEDVTNPLITSNHNDQQIDAESNCEVTLPIYTINVTATDNCNTVSTQTELNSENFENCANSTWHSFSVAGNTDLWVCNSGYQDINGYGDEVDEDWLIISSPINLDNYTDEVFSFSKQERYEGPNLEIYYSSDYSGSGSPIGSTWNSLPYTAIESSSSSTFSAWADNSIDLSNLTGIQYLAFKYTANSSSGGSEQWRIDDIMVTGYVVNVNSLDITQNPVAGTIISGETNDVTLTVTDDAGNTSQVIFNVAVIDNIDPTISCIENQAITLNEGETFYTVQGTEFAPTSTDDNCEVANTVNDFNNLATLENAQLPIGTTTIVWTVTDIAGNTNFCSFDVTVNAFVGIETLQQSGISIYPNPTNGIINFEFAENNIQKITIILLLKGVI